MALSRFGHSMLWQLATIVLLLLTEADKAYAKRKIPRCYKGCALNEKGKWVCRNGKNEIIYCYVAKGYSDTDDAPTPKPWQIDEDYFIDDYGVSVLDNKDILDKNEDGADVPDSDIPYAKAPIDQGGPMAVPYASSPIDQGGPMAVPYASSPIDEGGPMAVPYASSPIDQKGPEAATPDSAEAPGLASTPAPASSPEKSDIFLYSARRCTGGVPPCRVGCRGGRCCSNGTVFSCGPR
jgi:hypothetical protein